MTRPDLNAYAQLNQSDWGLPNMPVVPLIWSRPIESHPGV